MLKKKTQSLTRRHTRLAACATLVMLMPLLAACTSPPDAATTKQSLTEVVEDPTQPDAADELDIDAEPEPIVEPMECSRYLVITARGTGEPAKKQLLAPATRAIASARPDETTVMDLDYPADTDVKEGGTIGARTLIDTLNVQTDTCPEQRFVLLGYSQGALVIGDALSAPEFRLVGATVGELTADAAERILAIVFFGNPRFVGGEPYDTGSFDPDLNGLLPRPPATLEAFADRLKDYCVKRDFVCQSSLDLDEEGHVAYYDNGMPLDGAAFVITRLPPVSDVLESEASGDEPQQEAQEPPTPVR